MSEGVEQSVTLEGALSRLEEIARLLERSDLELEEALRLYEEGVSLLREAESVLGRAEERIQQLRASGEGYRLEPEPEGP
jgi:exodeoxyribonuclease VII small subunit